MSATCRCDIAFHSHSSPRIHLLFLLSLFTGCCTFLLMENSFNKNPKRESIYKEEHLNHKSKPSQVLANSISTHPGILDELSLSCEPIYGLGYEVMPPPNSDGFRAGHSSDYIEGNICIHIII